MVPAVGEEEEIEIRRVAATADWDPNQESDELLVESRAIEEEILGRGVWMRMWIFCSHLNPPSNLSGYSSDLNF